VSQRDLQRENRKLKQQLAEARAAIADRDAKIEKLVRDVALLQDTVNRLLSQRGRGLGIPENQGLLFADAAAVGGTATDAETTSSGDEGEDADEDDSPSRKRKSGGTRTPRKIDTTGLPCEERLHELPEEERICPDTGQILVPVGEKVFEELDYTRAQLSVIRHRQVVYGLPPEQAEDRQATPITAPMPPRPLENCAASAMLLAWLLVQKFANHLPLYRQERIFGRDGLRLPPQTLCDWVLRAAEVLQPIVADRVPAPVLQHAQ